MGEQIILHPTADGTERYLTAAVAGGYAGLFRLDRQNKFGGGEATQPSLAHLLRFEIRGVALAA